MTLQPQGRASRYSAWDGATLTIRASAVKAFERCPRLWRAGYVDGLRSPDTYATVYGTALHYVQERYLLGYEHPRDSQIDHPKRADIIKLCSMGLKHLPAPGEWKIEHEFTHPFADGVLLHGTIDMWDGDHQIRDHKTTSNIIKWGMTPKQLHADIQANLYAWYAMVNGATTPIDLRWVYYQRSPLRVVPVECSLDRDRILSVVDYVEGLSREMLLQLERYDDWLATPANVGDEPCYRYNGCHLLPYCNRAKRLT